MDSHPLTVRPLPADWEAPALRRLGEILFQSSPPPKRDAQIDTFLALFRSGELKRDSVLLASVDSNLVGAILAEAMPGASGVLWPPQLLVSPFAATVQDALIQAAVEQLRRGGIKSIQAFLAKDEVPSGEPLARNGFRYLTCVWTMNREIAPMDPPASAAEFLPVTPATLPALIDVLIRTYEGTLDCPELNDGRTADETRDGLVASSPDLNLWWRIRFRGEDAGVLILSRDGDRCDIGYLGILPSLRRRGIAADAVRFALSRAADLGIAEISLLVDSRNLPAIHLYRRFGFAIGGSREVFRLE